MGGDTLVVQSIGFTERSWLVSGYPHFEDPDLQGVYTNVEEQRVPMERPDRFAGRSRESITESELRQVAAESNAAAQSRREANAFGGLGLNPQRFDLTPSLAWLLVDPPDGRIPALTPLGERRRREYAMSNARPLTAAADSNLWYRCISIGVPRSMMPLPDAGTFRLVQSPDFVAIQHEMMHEARVIPLNRRALQAGPRRSTRMVRHD